MAEIYRNSVVARHIYSRVTAGVSAVPRRFACMISPGRGYSFPRPGFSYFFIAFAVFVILAASPCAFGAEFINNTAHATYSVGSMPIAVNSNRISIVLRTNAVVTFYKYAPLYDDAGLFELSGTECHNPSNDSFTQMPGPVPIRAPAPLPLWDSTKFVKGNVYHGTEPLFMTLSDGDQNVDPTVRETIMLTLSGECNGEKEKIRLLETGPDTGVFFGFLQTERSDNPVQNNCIYSTQIDCHIEVTYVDVMDGEDTSVAGALVDPYGNAFDTSTGDLVDGVTVTLMDTSTGRPADVYGDDGISSYPSTVVTGRTVSDSFGAVYEYPPGKFRFPLIAPGNYRLDVTPTPGYRVPSVVPTTEIQALPGAPFAIVPGSRGEVFTVRDVILHLDIPLDTSASSGIFLTKTPEQNSVSIGDLMKFRIDVENTSDKDIASVRVSDALPLGFRYRPGSTRISGSAASEPSISADGRTIVFTIDNVRAGEKPAVTYIVEVAAGTATGKAENTAVATDSGGGVSNTARASVMVTEAFLQRKSILMGRVSTGECDIHELEDSKGLKDIRIYLEDGTNTVTDEKGMYHFEGVIPGTHIVQIDKMTIPPAYELAPCGEDNYNATKHHSQFVDLQGGTLWRANFHLVKKTETSADDRDVKGFVSVEINEAAQAGGSGPPDAPPPENGAAAAKITAYEVAIRTGDVPIANLRLSVVLPKGAEYSMDSSSLGGSEMQNPQVMGNVLNYRLGNIESNWEGRLNLAVNIQENQESAGPAKALLTFDTAVEKNVRTPMAESAPATRSAEPPPAPATVAPPEDKAGTQDGPEAAGGEIGNAKQVEIVVPSSLINPVNTNDKKSRQMPEFDKVWLESTTPGFEWLWPYERYNPSIPSAKVAIKFDARKTLKLFLKGKEVDAFCLEDRMKSSDGRTAVYLWQSIHLEEGDNLFEAIEYNEDGTQSRRLEYAMHYSWPPIKAELAPEQTKLKADGRTPPAIAVLLTDKEGHPAREGVIGEYSVDPPFAPYQKGEDLQKNRITAAANVRTKFVVGEDGIAMIELQPTTKTGEAVIRIKLMNGVQEVRAWLAPEERDWIVVGLAEATVGYETVKGNTGNLADVEVQNGYFNVGRPAMTAGIASRGIGGTFNSEVYDRRYSDGRVAFFIKGQKKGSKWLTTMAYDSDKEGSIRDNDSLHSIIDPNKYYTLYGDTTSQQYDASSARALYLKLEKTSFYTLFGDYTTGLNLTELTKYNRSFNGLKSEKKGKNFDFNLFVSNTNQSFIKDEIRGNDTSGLYSLSRTNIVENSESLVLETRDRLHSEVIIQSEYMSRHVDYEVDYEKGTIYFKSPVYSRDVNFNPVYIVVDYESYDKSDVSYNYGGRGAFKLDANRGELGLTHIHEGRTGGTGSLNGVDAKYKFDKETEIRAEYARSHTDFLGDRNSGAAYLAELSHKSKSLDGRTYVRKQVGGFGLGQQNGAESGTRKLGFDVAFRFSRELSLKTESSREFNLASNAKRYASSSQIRYLKKNYNLSFGYRHVADHFDNGDVETSDQILTGAGVNLFKNKLSLSVSRDQSLKNKNESSDFPTRTTLGADYKFNKTTSLYVSQDFFQGGKENTNSTRVGLKTTPWEDAQLRTGLVQQNSENGSNLFSTIGLKQTWKLSKKWNLDASVDRSRTIKHPGSTPFNTNSPSSPGSDPDFTAFSLGAAYRQGKWTMTDRVDIRNSANEKKLGVATGIYGVNAKGLGLSQVLRVFRTVAPFGTESKIGNISFSLASRPERSKWIVLDRLDLVYEVQRNPGSNYNNWRIINNFSANRITNKKTQFSIHYGAKYVKNTIDGDDYNGFTDLTGLEARYYLTKKWDLGIRGNVLHSWNVDQYKYGYGISIGHDFADNLWISLGYNLSGMADRDFSASDFTSKGPYIKFRMRFDQGSTEDAVKWISGQ